VLHEGPIDCHAHVVPCTFPQNPSPSEKRWPCMVCSSNDIRTVTFGDEPFRALDSRSWDASRRLESMEENGIAAQVLSPMPELLSYWFDGQTAETLALYVNQFIAELVAYAPTRFCGLGLAPIQEPQRAVRFMATLKARFGLDGIEVGSNILGKQLGDPQFDPVWAAAEDLGLAVFVHALHPLSTSGLTGMITPLAGFPLDTGQAAASILLSGVLYRHPRLRIGFAHGGGALGAMLGRLDQGWRITEGFGGAAPELPSKTAAQFFYDSNVYDPAYLRYLATKMAPGRVFLGSDYPYEIMQLNPVGYLRSVFDAPALFQSVKRDAALRFLGQIT
jgi:aminocarboxymuconate-semialdehyde decarboxylase